jgi:hypothetical protein
MPKKHRYHIHFVLIFIALGAFYFALIWCSEAFGQGQPAIAAPTNHQSISCR